MTSNRFLHGARAQLGMQAVLAILMSAALRGQVRHEQIYSLDRAHSSVDFSIRFIGLTNVRGRFDNVRGTIIYDDDITVSSVTVWIDASSINTHNDFRDRDLKNNFFHVEQFPNIFFQSTSIEETADGFVARGLFTMHGVTREIEIPFVQLHGPMRGIWNMTRVGFSGGLTINRKDYGVEGDASWNVPFDLDRRAIGDEVEIELTVQALRPDWRDRSFNSDSLPSIGEILEQEVRERGLESALETYSRLVETSRDSLNFARSEFLQLGRLLLQEGMARESAAMLRLATELYPTNDRVWIELGRAYVGAGEDRAALEAYETALEIRPVHTEALELIRHLRN